MATGLTQLQSDIMSRVAQFIGQSDTALFNYFGVRAVGGKHSKAAWRQVTDRMLDTDQIDRRKALKQHHIKIKVMRVTKGGIPKEAISLPAFEFEELAAERWDDSTLRSLLREDLFLFVVFMELDSKSAQFCGVKFWKMPDADREGKVCQAWQQTVETIQQGVQLAYDSSWGRVTNNLIGASENKVVHVRPHASKSSYYAGSKNASHLPTPAQWVNRPAGYAEDWMTKQSFWLNKDYIAKQIADIMPD